jgi:hypothetical protein
MVRRVGDILLSKIPLLVVYNAFVDMYCRLQKQLIAENPNPVLVKWMSTAVGKRAETRGHSSTRMAHYVDWYRSRLCCSCINNKCFC